MLSTIHSGSLLGIDAHPVLVEVNSHEKGEPFIILVGLPDAAVKESQNRISSAMGNSGYKMPEQRTTVNLAPGDIKKEGTLYDLPIALALLAATSQIKEPNPIDDYIIAGELSLSGAIRPIKGGLALAILAKKSGKKGVILPKKSAFEASLVEGVSVIPADTLSQAAAFIKGQIAIQPLTNQHTLHRNRNSKVVPVSCFSEIKGQKAVRRAVEIAVAGGHNLLYL